MGEAALGPGSDDPHTGQVDQSLAGIPGPSAGDLSIRGYLTVLRRRWRLIASILGGLFAITLLYSLLATPTYEATASVVLRTESNQQVFPAVGASQAGSFVRQPESELEFAESDEFQARLTELTPDDVTVDPNYSDVDVVAIGARRSNLLDFTARSSDPDLALEGANLWARAYVETRHQLALDEINTTIDTTTEIIERLDDQKEAVLEPLAPLDEAIADATDPDVISRLTTQRLSLQQSLTADTGPIDAQLRVLRDDLAALRISAGFLDRSDISAKVNDEAETARKVGPLLARNLALATVIGLILALGAAPIWDNLQTKLTTAEDVEKVAGDIPVLAELPSLIDDGLHPAEPALEFGTPYVESLERLVTAVGLLQMSGEGRRILITSPMPGEGKTTVAAHLALRLSMAGIKTVVVDGDLRRPNLHNLLGLQNDKGGLRDVLSGHSDPRTSLVRPSPAIDLDVLLAGPPTIAPASLLRSSTTSDLLLHLAAVNEVVLVDSPPTLPVTDSQALAARAVDHVIVVVQAGKSTRPELAETLERLAAVGKRPAGIVLTRSTRSTTHYGYGYKHDVPGATTLPAPTPMGAEVGR